MNTWRNITIDDLGQIITGSTPPTKKAEHYGNEYPFITPTDIKIDSRIVQTERFLSQKGYEYNKNRLLPRNAVCVVCIASIGKICMTTVPSVTNQQINSVVVDQQKHDPYFVYYLLSTKADMLHNIAGGVATPIVNKSTFANLGVCVPPLKTQRKIAAVLSAYDDLIENNTRRIKTLEDMAQTLYQEWFVHFRFPGHENVPMVESPLGPIPQGWVINQVKELVANHIGGGWGKEKKDSKNIVPAYVIRGTDIVHVRHVRTDTCPLRYHTQSNFKTRQLEAGDIIMEISGGGKDWGVGRSVLVTSQMLRAFEESVICASFCKRLTLNNEIYSPFIFIMHLQEAYTNKDLEQYELRSTGIRNFQFTTFLEREWIPVPPLAIQRQFVVRVGSLIDSIQNMGAKNANLRQTRDLLLPKLISGEIDVSELDINII